MYTSPLVTLIESLVQHSKRKNFDQLIHRLRISPYQDIFNPEVTDIPSLRIFERPPEYSDKIIILILNHFNSILGQNSS